MTKLKKLLLTLAPISAIMIATPIILTSCSTNAEQNNGGSQGGGSGTGGDTGNNGGGSGTGGDTGNNGGGSNTNPTLTADSTNSKTFKPTTEKGLYVKVEETIKSGKVTDEVNGMVDKAFQGYNTLSDKDIIDSINIWSNNKWIGATKNANVTYTSKIEKATATPKAEGNAKKWTIDFTYKFQISTKNGDKTENVLAEKTYSVKDSDLLTNKGVVDFTTKPTMLMVDGKSLLDDKGGKTFFNNQTKAEDSKVLQDVKKFLNDGTSKFDAKAVFKEFVTNHEIKGEQQTPALTVPTWDEEKIKKETGVNLAIDKSKPTELTLTLTETANAEWGSCVTSTTYDKVYTTFSTASDYKYQKKFKSLVSPGDYEISGVDYGKEIKGDKTSSMIITISFKKKTGVEGEDTSPTLTFKISGFAKTGA